jgi:hypothetical protein
MLVISKQFVRVAAIHRFLPHERRTQYDFGHAVREWLSPYVSGERFLDERRISFAEGRIYSTVGYADTALALPCYTDV